MAKYAYETENRRGVLTKAPNYFVKWEWKNPELSGSYLSYVDLTNATNAERAISKIRKLIVTEYCCARTDIVILEVGFYEGMTKR